MHLEKTDGGMTSSIHGRWPQVILCALLTVLLACTGYWMLFTNFTKNDDEGTVLLSVRLFCAGHALYTDVFSHQPVELKPEMIVTMKPWEYRVMTN